MRYFTVTIKSKPPIAMKKSILLSLLAALFLAGASALHAGTAQPMLKKGEMPEYPDIARAQAIEGVVVIAALVDEKGRVFGAEVVQSVHKSIDKAALEAVKKWAFVPAKQDGEPIMKMVHIPIRFELEKEKPFLRPDKEEAVAAS